jgi:3-deoxy-D-manno-octulosonic acid kinase
MRSLRNGRLDFGAPVNDATPGGNGTSLRRRLDGYDCRLVAPLDETELQQLIAALTAPHHADAISPRSGPLSGRAIVRRHDIPSVGPVVIKEFQRGGMLRVIRQRYYVRFGTTRPEREFDNLRSARSIGLNVPEPVACFSRGILLYRGWLATRHIPGRSLVEVAMSDDEAIPALIADLTRQVGILIGHRVAHVDLHPGNVLVDPAGAVFLLDFDRATAFTEPLGDLRRRYEVRWTRAVEKHGLPEVLADHFRKGLDALSLGER